MVQNKTFKLFSNCIPVKGAKRSTICDLQRNEVKLIPNDLAEILIKYEGKAIGEIKVIYQNKYDSIIDEYFEFLLENEFIFFTNQPELFPKMSLDWEDPSVINNAIIDRDSNSNYDLYNILDQLDELNCRHIELRYFNSIELTEILDILKYLENAQSTIISVDVTMPYNESLRNLNDVIIKNKRLASFKIFNSLEDTFTPPLKENMGFIIYTKKQIKNSSCCGLISKDFFVVNTPLFTESVNHNSCLNHKVGIDVDGNIKNCPSMKKSFGNVLSQTLEECLNKKTFKKYWKVKKDNINICKDCEFRHICTDCRAFIEDPNDIYSKPLKCGYNPYTNEWKDWSTNKLNIKTIQSYHLDGK
ncbi:grasp-with-spasm system SPASM domain peptide maturase [uncultured Winogradskyella sp.]|uniref:grasp-with-spasm system SPASM domain peptide maturase n=1 Tax=uncultured Winogradskyella sp. TaxID=395353 RepID=UPI0026303607|nr:grasp-with-spasm system SPASM domain peptide maturase [uncultured Winogradskyella sp.]